MSLGFSMAPWGYCITVDSIPSDTEQVYACHRESCNEIFRFPKNTPEAEVRAAIYPHLDEKH